MDDLYRLVSEFFNILDSDFAKQNKNPKTSPKGEITPPFFGGVEEEYSDYQNKYLKKNENPEYEKNILHLSENEFHPAQKPERTAELEEENIESSNQVFKKGMESNSLKLLKTMNRPIYFNNSINQKEDNKDVDNINFQGSKEIKKDNEQLNFKERVINESFFKNADGDFSIAPYMDEIGKMLAQELEDASLNRLNVII